MEVDGEAGAPALNGYLRSILVGSGTTRMKDELSAEHGRKGDRVKDTASKKSEL
jgi:hypothetical protein